MCPSVQVLSLLNKKTTTKIREREAAESEEELTGDQSPFLKTLQKDPRKTIKKRKSVNEKEKRSPQDIEVVT